MDPNVKIEWSAVALADLDRFANFLQSDFPNLATVVAQEIIAKADMIAANPHLGRVLDERRSFRQVVLRVLNAAYVFQYRYDGSRLSMLRVFHSRENP
jgi:plasmid stabilization system protein ParE